MPHTGMQSMKQYSGQLVFPRHRSREPMAERATPAEGSPPPRRSRGRSSFVGGAGPGRRAGLLVLFVAIGLCAVAAAGDPSSLSAAGNSEPAAGGVNTDGNADAENPGEGLDEDLLVRETIAAGRGDREKRGIRDQWASDEHLGSSFDARRPVSPSVRRLLDAYGLDCTGCDHSEAVKAINAHAREDRERRRAREKRDALARKVFGTLAAVLVVLAVWHREPLAEALGVSGGSPSGGRKDAASVALRRRRAADAASKRAGAPKETHGAAHRPLWLDHERREVWTAKQEKQFSAALREFSGVPKKERYRLVAERVTGKSRIECLTHHRMQEYLERMAQQQQE